LLNGSCNILRTKKATVVPFGSNRTKAEYIRKVSLSKTHKLSFTYYMRVKRLSYDNKIKQQNLPVSDPLQEALQNTLPLFAQKLKINHFSPTQFVIPDAAWLFKYVFMDQKMRRELLPSNAAMEAGKIVGEVLQRIYADTIYKLHPVKKKVAATTNEKISKDAALQEEIEKLKEYVPNDEKDSDKKQKYLEEIPVVINHALDGLKKLAVASPITCERQISINHQKVSFHHIAYCWSY
jgi:hypothetical protein